MARSFDSATLVRLRQVPLAEALQALDVYFKPDPSFEPVKDASTQRWMVNAAGADFELLVTDLKWFDTRAGKGGGGAIDLCMHLLGLDFVGAVKLLVRAGL